MNMARKELILLMPTDKNDVSTAERIVGMGFPAVEPVMWDMVKWLRVADSPVADAFADFFGGLGEPAVEVIQRGIIRNDCLIRRRILTRVLPEWPVELLRRMVIPLGALMTQPDACDNDIRAMLLLLKHRLIEMDAIVRWLSFKRKSLAIRQNLLLEAEVLLEGM